MMNRCDPWTCIIVGGGPTGLILATKVMRKVRGARVLVLEEGSRASGACGAATSCVDVRSGVPQCPAKVPLGAMRVLPSLERTLALFAELGIPIEPFGFGDQWVFHNGRSVPVADAAAVNALFGVEPPTTDLSVEAVRVVDAVLADSTGLPPALRTVAQLRSIAEPTRVKVLARARWRGKPLANWTWFHALSAYSTSAIRVALDGVSGFEFIQESRLSLFLQVLWQCSWAGGAGFDDAFRPVGGFSSVFDALRRRACAAGVDIRYDTRVCAVTPGGGWCVRTEDGESIRAPVCVLALAPGQIRDVLVVPPPSLGRHAGGLQTVPTTKALVVVVDRPQAQARCRDFVLRDATGRQFFRWAENARRTAWMGYFTGDAGSDMGAPGIDQAAAWRDQLRSMDLASDDSAVSMVRHVPIMLQFWGTSSDTAPNAGRCNPTVPASDPGTAQRRWMFGLGRNLFAAHSFLSTSWQGWLEGSLQTVEILESRLVHACRSFHKNVCKPF